MLHNTKHLCAMLKEEEIRNSGTFLTFHVISKEARPMQLLLKGFYLKHFRVYLTFKEYTHKLQHVLLVEYNA